MKKIILVFTILLTTIPVINAQQLDIVWQQCLGTDVGDFPYCIIETDNGVLTSTSIGKDAPYISNYHGAADAWLVELDTLGNIIWEKCFGGSGGEGIYKIIELPNNEYYLLGGTNSTDGDVQSNNHDNKPIWVVKIDSSRNIIWEECYGSNSPTSLKDAIVTEDGGLLLLARFFVGGVDISTHYGNDDAWLCRIDPFGKILWEKSYGNHSSDELLKIIYTSSDTYMLLGSFKESGGMITCQKDDDPEQRDIWLIEIDTIGNIIRQFCYGGSNWEQGMDIIEIDGGYVITGYTDSNDMDVSGLHMLYPDIYKYDIWILKIDYDGQIVWQNCLGGTKNEYGKNIFTTQDGGYMLFGTTQSIDGDVVGSHDPYEVTSDVWVVKVNNVGELQWQQCYGSYFYEDLYTSHQVTKIDDYSYVITCAASRLSGDVECLINPTGEEPKDAWVFQIKDCTLYQPTTPQQPIGQDTLCAITDSITTYTTQFANGAWAYEWELVPGDAGILVPDSLTATIHWNPLYEGEATIKVRSYNDCGTSTWSDGIVVNIYICLGTDEISTNPATIMVYPNPASKLLTVSYNSSTSAVVEVLNIYSKQIYSTNIPRGKQTTTIDVTNWHNGLYIVRILQNGRVVGWRKVVVE